jgi:hypothetical protein
MDSDPRTTHRRRAAGFTIVESVSTMTILAVLGSISSALVYTGVNSYRDASTLAQIHEEEATAMARLGTEFRNIPMDTSVGSMAPQVASVTPTSMAWNSNYSLALSGSQLQLVEAGGAASTLLNNVTAFTIQCYDQNNAALAPTLSGADCNPIRRVSVSVTVSRQGITETLRSKFFIRSMIQGGTL